MARVFRGKVAIPGEQMEAYFEALERFENDKKPLRKQLEHSARAVERVLAQQYTPKTVRKHTAIIALFIDSVCWDTDVRCIEEITRGIAHSYFRQWYLRKVGDRTESELKTAIKKFFSVSRSGKRHHERGRFEKFSTLAIRHVLMLPAFHNGDAGLRLRGRQAP